MKIIIRKARPGDEKGIADFMTKSLKKRFFKYLATNTPPSKERLNKWRQMYSSKNKNSCVMVAVDTDSDRIIGAASFSGKPIGRTRHSVDLGWSVHHKYARKGVGTLLVKSLITEAEKRKIHRLEAFIAVKNIASIKLAQKFGFAIEGVGKDSLLLDNGKYMDMYTVAKILK